MEIWYWCVSEINTGIVFLYNNCSTVISGLYKNVSSCSHAKRPVQIVGDIPPESHEPHSLQIILKKQTPLEIFLVFPAACFFFFDRNLDNFERNSTFFKCIFSLYMLYIYHIRWLKWKFWKKHNRFSQL